MSIVKGFKMFTHLVFLGQLVVVIYFGKVLTFHFLSYALIKLVTMGYLFRKLIKVNQHLNYTLYYQLIRISISFEKVQSKPNLINMQFVV